MINTGERCRQIQQRQYCQIAGVQSQQDVSQDPEHGRFRRCALYADCRSGRRLLSLRYVTSCLATRLMPQRSVLSHILFVLYTADVVWLSCMASPLQCAQVCISVAFRQKPRNYRYAPLCRDLGACVDGVAQWMSSNRPQLNVGKRNSCGVCLHDVVTIYRHTR